ncbi:integrase catalytic domain-containing protein [Nephila pilipes]|uniref:Integrase catalytic domain-containing protein n=1 Tax=Nephila pilipes TaxID=299642 RepID=A0A8X6NDV0_NEPPI|nr:integrase catalytic domain-containing protein [Nephila pilipes]
MRDATHEAELEVSYYMPHHGVYRPDKKTTKLRFVFNASNETTNGTSFNSLEINGGLVQVDLILIMMRFRQDPYAYIADIQKMCRMINIHPSQRNLQCIVWKDSENFRTFNHYLRYCECPIFSNANATSNC